MIPPNQRHHDFGSVAKASKTEHRFVLTNPFPSDLVIQSVRASCGCTTPILEHQTIKPGETGSLIAHFNTDRFNGEKKATLTLSISRPYATELQLNVRGYIRTDVVMSPGEADFGSVPESTSRQLSIDLNYAGRSDWQIADVVCPFPFIRSEFREISRGGGRVRYAIDVELQESAPAGYLESQLVVRTNDNRLKSFPIRVTASVDQPLKAAPAQLALGRVKPSEPLAQRLTISGKNAFQVLDVRSEAAEIRFEQPAKSSRIHLLNLIIAPSIQGGLVDAEVKSLLRIYTDLADEPFELPLTFSFEVDKLAGANQAP